MAAPRTPDGPPPAPVVQRLRIRYARRGRMRFTSTRDFARALERALRRAGVPMAFSAGFHPHPRISYAGGAPTGMASEAEYLEIALAERCDPDEVRTALDAALPAGLDIVEVVEAGARSLNELLEASAWEIAFAELSPESLAAAVGELTDLPEALVTRMFKTGEKTFDVLPAVVAAEVGAGEGCAILHLVVRHTTPAVRPDDVLSALRQATRFDAPSPPKVTRIAQGPWDAAAAHVADPLAADANAAAAAGDAP
ncbi:MAG: TIGR03936 family radical SAM-associated protein [Dermatophilaceae bacterium]